MARKAKRRAPVAAKERILRASTSVATLGSSGLTPTPFQFTLGADDHIRVTTFDQRTDAQLDITVRQWRDDTGEVVITTDTVPSVMTVVGAVRELPVAAGALLNVRIGTPTAALRYGDMFVRVQLVRNTGTAAIVLGTLLQGYVSVGNDLGWPGSPLQTMHDGRGVIADGVWGPIASPLQLKAIVPAWGRWRVICGSFFVTTSAVPGARAVIAQAINAFGGASWFAVAAPDQPASTTVFYNIGAGMPPTALTSNGDAYLPWPNDLELDGGSAVVMLVGGAQAGDTVTPQGLLVRQWLDQ